MREFDAYLFDADGTIIDTRELICRCFVYMGKVMEVRLPSRPEIEATIGLPVQRQVRDFLGWGRPDAYYAEAIRAYGEHMMKIYPEFLGIFPGVAEGLAELTRRGKKLAVVTSRGRSSLTLYLETMGIARFFPVLVTPDDTEKHKPDPAPAIFAMKLLAAEPGSTVFVGDAEFDIRCGKAAGTATAYVEWGGMDYQKWPVQPDFTAKTFAELLPE
ncbi:MAG: HAD-IA family hydrolase [Planctomycetes bacterium]|nr:HAD-IA family hydrolase [Planctomycetota bacterium]